MIDINKFCGDTHSRAWMKNPFSIDGRVAATNGHIILILHNQDCSGYLPLENDENEACVLRLINSIETASDYAPINKETIILPEKERCIVCQGSGKAIKIECIECGGDGSVDASNDFNTYHDLTCASCDGIGFESDLETDEACLECAGAGKTYKDKTVDVLEILVQAKYLSLIIDEPDLQLTVDADRSMLMFKSDKSSAFGAICPRY